jgi:hypothetical protein
MVQTTVKRFDTAIEIAKQLLTICVALIGGLAAFIDKIILNDDHRFLLLLIFVSFICWLISIVFGIFHLGAVTNLIETQERTPATFVSTFGAASAELGKWQQLCFFFGIAVILVAFFWDRFLL